MTLYSNLLIMLATNAHGYTRPVPGDKMALLGSPQSLDKAALTLGA